MKTIDYYNQYADQFLQATLYVDMESLYQPFLAELPDSARILDLGCGSGRDTLAFKNKGYQVEAIDYSEELVKKATILSGVKVKLQSFYDLSGVAIYDGIWACASLLHCERSRLVEVIGKLISVLKPGGVLYMSFKYGNSDREKEGRQFTDLDEAQANDLLEQFDNVQQIQQWITVDQRPDRQEKWLNLLWKKHA
ncbi:class I SAM-dependent methyltransferase (plasmid) [Acinetobacter sp. YH12138]|uniref:class I SAM-dependent DNA methyltransferase n=1 Tax=unclassified Acinetobacter TaxID=196816 RepID=UPI0015D235C5|nr:MULTISPECIES: class I SAM-dependent methyltransferase [unclassified Acinetobacter]QOW51479.1 class I SAM-dependent methyltransferase [Acinetobacter sp. YH12138]